MDAVAREVNLDLVVDKPLVFQVGRSVFRFETMTTAEYKQLVGQRVPVDVSGQRVPVNVSQVVPQAQEEQIEDEVVCVELHSFRV